MRTTAKRMKCKICGKSRKVQEMSRHHRLPQRERQQAKGRGVSLMCVYCHRILHTAEIQGLCKLPTEDSHE